VTNEANNSLSSPPSSATISCDNLKAAVSNPKLPPIPNHHHYHHLSLRFDH
jgi:hypothetical protein